jgi:acyl carrier protein
MKYSDDFLPMNQTKQIRDFVISNFMFGEGAGLNDDASLIDRGIVDSTGMLELIVFLEETFRLKIDPDEMIPENLDSVTKAAAFVSRKTAPAQVQA